MRRILIVDDSADLQDSFEAILDSEGYEVSKASDGAAGLRAIAGERPDAVLLDMMMPDVDGLQVLQRLPIECPLPLPPVIAISGFEAYRQEALRRGAVAFLRKPIEVDVLLSSVRAALAGAPIPADLIVHNRQDVIAARARGALLRGEIVDQLDPLALTAVTARLQALAGWLQRYYGYGATFIQLLRGSELRIEATRGGSPPWLVGYQYPSELTWCHDVIDAGSTVLLCDPKRHPLSHFAQHAEIAGGFRFYAGVPLTTWSGAVVGSLCLCDVEPHVLHSEDMRMLEALGLHIAHALEEVAAGVDADDFVLDGDALFQPEMLPLFVQIAVQRAARAGGAVGVAVVRLADDHDADRAASAAYAGGSGPGLVVTRRHGDEVALVTVGHQGDAHVNLRAALDACGRAVAVTSIGSAWCGMAAGSSELADDAQSDIAARLIGLAAEAHDHASRDRHDPHDHHAAA